MKPNEVIGFSFLGLMIGVIFWGIVLMHFNVFVLLFVGLLGIGQMVFLSLWGLWTFNPWFEKTFGRPK